MPRVIPAVRKSDTLARERRLRERDRDPERAAKLRPRLAAEADRLQAEEWDRQPEDAPAPPPDHEFDLQNLAARGEA